MTQRDPELQLLIDKVAIRRLLAHYPWGLDRHDSELLASIYHPRRDRGPRHLQRLDRRDTTQIIEIDGDVAHTETYCLASKRQPEPDELGRARESLVRVRYLDRVERREGVWKIAHRRVVSRTRPTGC